MPRTTGYSITLSLGTLLTTDGRACYANALILQIFVSFLVGNGVTSLWHTVRLVLLSSPISSPFIHFRTPSHVPRLPTPFSPHFFLALPHTSRPGLSTEPFYPSSCPPTHFLSSNFLDDIFRPPSLSLTPPPPYTLILSHYDYKFTSLLPLSLTLSHLPPFPTPPASHSFTVFGYCP